ncbi:MAG: hypothetical protein IPO63_15330 [Bacteroidetes bacterium]|nr:hypothetical protein [Bacteroidota bacterium]
MHKQVIGYELRWVTMGYELRIDTNVRITNTRIYEYTNTRITMGYDGLRITNRYECTNYEYTNIRIYEYANYDWLRITNRYEYTNYEYTNTRIYEYANFYETC